MPPQLGREVQERVKVYGPLNELTYEGRLLTQTLQDELVSTPGDCGRVGMQRGTAAWCREALGTRGTDTDNGGKSDSAEEGPCLGGRHRCIRVGLVDDAARTLKTQPALPLYLTAVHVTCIVLRYTFGMIPSCNVANTVYHTTETAEPLNICASRTQIVSIMPSSAAVRGHVLVASCTQAPARMVLCCNEQNFLRCLCDLINFAGLGMKGTPSWSRCGSGCGSSEQSARRSGGGTTLRSLRPYRCGMAGGGA